MAVESRGWRPPLDPGDRNALEELASEFLTRPVAALASLFARPGVARARDTDEPTTYESRVSYTRVWRAAKARVPNQLTTETREKLLVLVGERAGDVSWNGFNASLDAAMEDYREFARAGDNPDAIREMVLAALRLNFRTQFSSKGVAAGWLIHAASITSSPQWDGPRPNPRLARVGRELLRQRRESFAAMEPAQTELLELVLARLGRRLKPGVTLRQIIVLLGALSDGLVLRRILDANDVDVADAAEAMWTLAEAYTEMGTIDDPRRPPTERDGSTFDAIVVAARNMAWPSGGGGDPVASAIIAAGIDRDEARAVAMSALPTAADLADSVVRLACAPQRLSFQGALASTYTQEMVAGSLLLLQTVLNQQPQLIETLKAQPPASKTAYVDDLRATLELLFSHEHVADPTVAARRAIAAALGSGGQEAISASLNPLREARKR